MVVLTPLEIYNKNFSKSFRGYREDEVDSFIDKVLADYEKLFKENLDLKETFTNHHAKLEQYREIEETLHNSIIIAQQTAEQVQKNAEERAALLNKQAEQRAREIIIEAQDQIKETMRENEDLKQRTLHFKIKLKSFLQAQLDVLIQDIGNNQVEEEK
jgi:cell division initiation protein